LGAEGAIALAAGFLAGSIALMDFGIDSAIEGLTSLVIVALQRPPAALQRRRGTGAEARRDPVVPGRRYAAAEAIRHLVIGAEPEVSVLGMVLTVTSLVGMPLLGIAKQ
jgi:hypothetical protein